MNKIVLISGKARNGKDTFANYLKESLENYHKKVLILHYGDFLKAFCQNNLGWNGIKDESGRQLLQHYGTDVVRATYQDTWVDMMVALIRGIQREFDYILIPDTRFPNEVEKIKAYFPVNTISMRVERDNFSSNLTLEQKNHPSETALDNYKFDYVIKNNGSLVDLVNNVQNFIKKNIF